MFAALSMLIAFSAHAQESCSQCKFARCLKGQIERKKVLAANYDTLATKWDKLVLQDGNAVAVIDLSAIVDAAERNAFMRDLLKKINLYHNQADEMNEQVPPAADCSNSGPEGVGTNPFTCITDQAIAAAKTAAECKEIGELLDKHETVHRESCIQRRQTCIQRGQSGFWKYFPVDGTESFATSYPSLIQTPAGNAREEAAAYRLEITSLQKLYDKAIKGCKLSYTGVTLTCNIRMPGIDLIERGTNISATTCGDPVTTLWNMTTDSWRKAPRYSVSHDKPWQSDCVEKGSPEEQYRLQVKKNAPNGGGWMCIYDKGPPERITIRNFPGKFCSPNTEQVFTVDLKRSSESCEAKPPTRPVKPTPAPTTPTPPIPAPTIPGPVWR